MKASQMIAVSATTALVAVICHSAAPITTVGVVFYTFMVMMMVMLLLMCAQLIREIGKSCDEN